MSQSPWSTVSTATPTSPRDRRARPRASARPRSEPRVLGAVGRLVGAVLDGLEAGDGAERRLHRAGRAAAVSPSQSVCSERDRAALGVPVVVAGDADAVDAVGRHHRLRAVERGRAATPPPRLRPWSGLASASVPTSRLSQPDRDRRAGVGVLDLLHRGEVRAVRRGQAGRVHGGHLAGGPERQQRLERRVQAEHAVLGEQRVGRDGDAGPGRVVDRVGVRDDERQPVAGAAQREHDEDRGRGRGGRRRGGDDGGAEDGRRGADGAARRGTGRAGSSRRTRGSRCWSAVIVAVTCS